MEMTTLIAWLCLGIVLIVAELMTLTFVLLFFGVSALLTALFIALGLENIYAQIVIFSLMGLSGIFLFRKKMVQAVQVKGAHNIDGMKNASFNLDADIPQGGSAAITYRGIPWTAVNESGENLSKGERVVIDRMDGVKLVVKK